MAQLVGLNCIRCKDRITNELDSRFCPECGSAVHNSCARPVAGLECPVCGGSAALPVPVSPILPPPAPIATETDSYRIALQSWGKMGVAWGLGGGIGTALNSLIWNGYRGIKLIIAFCLIEVIIGIIVGLIIGVLRTAMFRRKSRRANWS